MPLSTYQELIVDRLDDNLLRLVLADVEPELELLAVTLFLNQRRIEAIEPCVDLASLVVCRGRCVGCAVNKQDAII